MRLCLCFVFFTLFGCDEKNTGDELSNKPEYSLLQSYAYKYSEFRHNQKFLLVKKALGTDYNVLAFPIKNSEKGYVVMLSNAQEDPKGKRIPDKEFNLDTDTLKAVKKSTKLSIEVQKLIKEHVDKTSENL